MLQLASQGHSRRTVWSISDYWFGQGLAYAAGNLTPASCAEYEEFWHEAAARVDYSPKLLALLDPPWESRSRWQTGLSQIPLQMENWIRVRDKLVELLKRPGWGPVLHLRQPDPAMIVAQLGAAIDAMQ